VNDIPHRGAHRASTDEQKRIVIERLYALWCANPELRLGQLLGNVRGDMYHEEDFDLIETLQAFYREFGMKAQE